MCWLYKENTNKMRKGKWRISCLMLFYLMLTYGFPSSQSLDLSYWGWVHLYNFSGKTRERNTMKHDILHRAIEMLHFHRIASQWLFFSSKLITTNIFCSSLSQGLFNFSTVEQGQRVFLKTSDIQSEHPCLGVKCGSPPRIMKISH